MIKSICAFFMMSLVLSCNPSKEASSNDHGTSNIDNKERMSHPISTGEKVYHEGMRDEQLGSKVTTSNKSEEVAYVASGCFWCIEAVYESVRGVSEVISGYAEGLEENANYAKVSSGSSNHVEAIKIIYDPAVVDYKTLLIVFFGSGNPTTLNQQGPDKGYQYRSAIYYTNKEEKEIAENLKASLESTGVFDDPIVTDITPFTTFFDAENYHQDFEKRNPNQPYIRSVSIPRLNRFKKAFPELLK